MTIDNSESNYFSDLTWLQGKAAFCENEEQLAFHIVNHTIKIAPYAQGVLWSETKFGINIIAISGVSVINHSSPYISFLEKYLIPQIISEQAETCKINIKEYEHITANYGGYIFPWCLSLPFYTENKPDDKHSISAYKKKSGLILFSKEDWTTSQVDKLDNIVNYYKYLWDLFLRQSDFNINKIKKIKKARNIIVASLLLAMFIPINDSMTVPGEIAPSKPLVVASAVSGIVAEFYVRPNDFVTKGESLFKLDTTATEKQLKQALKNLNISKEKYKKVYNQPYKTPEAKAELAILESEIKLAEGDLMYKKGLLDSSVIRAEITGTVILSDPKYWLGRQVEVGQKVLLLAYNDQKQLDIHIPVDELKDVGENKKIRFYPSTKPLSYIDGDLLFISKKADIRPDNTLAYFAAAKLDSKDLQEYEFGVTGDVKVYGKRVLLGYYLFAKPIGAVRRFLGV